MTKIDHSQAVAVLGAGSWGTALALLLARNGLPVFLWGHDAAHMATINHERKNSRYLPDFPFPDNLYIRSDLPELINEVKRVLIVVPSHAFRTTLEAIKPSLKPDAIVLWATKGLEQGSQALLSEVADNVLPAAQATAVLSGPTFAEEVARDLPTALTIASKDPGTAEDVAGWLRAGRIRIYTSEDMIGVQLGGAIKNVMAIAAGISDGLGFGANARAALITRGLAELTRLGVAMGGKPETFMGLTGAGDLVLTCTDNKSRNRRVGIALGQGKKLDQILSDLGQEAEGVLTARELHVLAKEKGVDMPITEQVYRVLYKNITPREVVEALLQRESGHE
ncbi:MAG: NAD(P)H-dependent glycerol-3-phosphate dehydrogenase [Acidiferrobacterales bacterium]